MDFLAKFDCVLLEIYDLFYSKNSLMKSLDFLSHRTRETPARHDPDHMPSRRLFSLSSGMDFFVVLERPGFRVAKRRRKQSKIGAPHKLKKADAMKFFQSKFDGIILAKAYA